MPAALVDERGAIARHAVQLRPMGLPSLDQLVGPVAHALLPFTGFQAAGMVLEALEDVVDAGRAAQVGAESRQPVVDDVRVGVVKAWKHGGSGEVDDPRPGTAQAHHLATAAGKHLATGNGKVSVGIET